MHRNRLFISFSGDCNYAVVVLSGCAKVEEGTSATAANKATDAGQDSGDHFFGGSAEGISAGPRSSREVADPGFDPAFR